MVFEQSSSLEGLVLEAVRHIAHKTELPAYIFRGLDAELYSRALEFIEAVKRGIWSYSYILEVDEPVREGVGKGLHTLVKGYVLDGIHHIVDSLLLLAERVRAHRGPVLLVVVPAVLPDQHRSSAVQQFEHPALLERRVRIVDLAAGDEGHQLGRVRHRHRGVHVYPVLLVEPRRVFQPLVLDIHCKRPHPVDVGSVLQPAMDVPEGEILRIDGHLSVQGRCGYPLRRMETYLVSLPAIDIETVHQVVVVIRQAVLMERRRDLHVEDIYVILVEVGLDVHIPGELGDRLLLLEAGHPARLYYLLLPGRIAGVIVAGRGFGYHHRQVRLAGDHRRIQIFIYELETLGKEFL